MFVDWLRLTIGFVLLLSVTSKLRSPDAFSRALAGYVLFLPRPRLRKALSIAIPVSETATAVALLVPTVPAAYGSGMTAALLLAFTFAILANVREGVASACGCGIGHLSTGYLAVTRNCILFIGVIAVWVAASPISMDDLRGYVALYVLAFLGSVLVIAVPNVLQELEMQIRSSA